ncbi:MAG: VOC family protein [Oscillospiraceae bacterium]|nr:VOC family protein [Oscillospiraceae bacterium]
MKYEVVCMAVKDVAASKQFYQDLLGLEIDTDWGDNVSFKGCAFALQQGFAQVIGVPEERVKTRAHNMELVFEADDFDGFVAKLERYPNIAFVRGGVVEQPWGQRAIHFYDLDGHVVEVGEKFLHVMQRFVASGMTVEDVAQRCGIPVVDVEKYLNGEF